MVAMVEGGKVKDIRMACGAVQCTPRRLKNVEDLVKGEAPNADLEKLVGRVAAQGAKPLTYNAFKITLMENK